MEKKKKGLFSPTLCLRALVECSAVNVLDFLGSQKVIFLLFFPLVNIFRPMNMLHTFQETLFFKKVGASLEDENLQELKFRVYCRKVKTDSVLEGSSRR